jgi:hypothetical protein
MSVRALRMVSKVRLLTEVVWDLREALGMLLGIVMVVDKLVTGKGGADGFHYCICQ